MALLAGRSAAAWRGVYLWAGAATVDLHNVKFPDRAVDRVAHAQAHSAEAAQLLAERGINWAFLSMNWGFPPELEAAHWAEFGQATRTYHAAGIRVIGYVQASNCVAAGSYADRDWYALSFAGRHIPYFRNRLMTCWNHSGWLEEVGRHAERVIELGGDGVFFDNLWMGATPWMLGAAAGGFAGCACMRCRLEFERSSGTPLPRRIDADQVSAAYLEWRARIVAQRLRDWAVRVRGADDGALVLANNCDAVLRDTSTLFGQCLGDLAPLQDALLVENIAMPRYDARRRRLVANALPLKAVRAVAGDRPILAVTYERGIGLDGPPPAARLRRAMAEAAAVGAAPVLKGSEYLDHQRQFTVVTAPTLRPALDAAASLLRWLESNARLFEGAVPAPLVHVFYDAGAMERRWKWTAPGTLATALALVRAGIPFEFATADRLPSRSPPDPPLLVPPGVEGEGLPDGTIMLEPDDVGGIRVPGRALDSRIMRRAADVFLSALSRGYFGSARIRRLIDATGMTARFLQSPFFGWKSGPRIVERCHVTAPCRPSLPALVERWRLADGGMALHVVNYAGGTNRIAFDGDEPARLHTPDADTLLVRTGETVHLDLSTYAVLEWPVVRPMVLEP